MTSSSTGDARGEIAAFSKTGLGVRHLWIVVAIGALALRATSAIQDNSFLWHIRAGTLQLEAGQVLRTDPFSFTAFGEPWRTQSWLLELGYGFLEHLTGGLGWVRFMLFLFGAATVVLVGIAAYARARDATASGVTAILLVWTFWFFLVPRPVSASFVLLAAVVVVLQHRERLGWAVVPLLWVWAAVHGTFIVGIGLVVLEAIRLRSTWVAKMAALGAVVAALTAHGLGTWQVTFDFFANREALGFLSEWGPPDFQNPALWPFVLVLGGLLVAAVRSRLDLRDLVVVFPFVAFGLLQQRTVLPALIVLLPYAAPAIAGTISETGAGLRVLNRGIAAAVAVFAAVVLVGSGVRLSETRFPPDVVVAGLTPGPLFNGVRAGGYLIWAQGPERLVFIDDRAELFGADGFRRAVDVIDGKGWREVFAEYGIEQAIVETDWPLAAALGDAGWRTIAEGGGWGLLTSR